MTEETTIPRRTLGAFLAPILGPEWSNELAYLADWNPRTVERLGTRKMPADRRRLEVLAQCVRGQAISENSAHIAEWLEKKAAGLAETQTS